MCETKLSPAYGGTFSSRFSYWSDESSDPTPGNEESMTRGRIRQATERETTNLPPTSRPKLKPVVSDTMKEMNRRLDFLIEKYDRMERFGKEEKGVRLNFSSISDCLPDNGSRLEVVGNNTAKYHHWRIPSFEETLASVSERWGVASSAEFPLSSLDGYTSGDDESSDPSSGNDEPITRGRDRQESADMIGPVDVDMQSALSNSCISSPTPADVTANKETVSSECVRSDPVPGIGESKTRGRVRRKKAKKVARPRPRHPLNGFNLSLKSVKRPINRLKGRRKIMAAHHYRLKPGENSASSLWLKQKRPINRLKGRRKIMAAHHYRLKPGENSASSLWLKRKQPKHHSKLKGRKKVMVAHHYWLKPGEDMTCPLWLKHQPKYTCSHRASFDLCWPKDPSIIVAHI